MENPEEFFNRGPIPSSTKQIELFKEGRKDDSGKVPLDLIDSIALTELGKVLQFGAQKYARHNWRAGIAWSRVIAAALRHIEAFNAGEDFDPETKLPHVAHAMCCLMFLTNYFYEHPEFDDRYKKPAK